MRDEDRAARPGRPALAYSSSQLAFMTSRTQFRLSPALMVAPIWYQPSGVADRYRLTPASARLTGAVSGRMTWAPVPTVSWTSPGPIPLPRAAAAVSPAPAATGMPAGSPSSLPAWSVSWPASAPADGSSGRQQAGLQAERADHLKVPAVAHHVVEQGGGRVTRLGVHLAGQPGP